AGLAAVVVETTGDLNGESLEVVAELVAVREIAGERRLGTDGFALEVRFDGTVVFAARELLEEGAARAERALEQRWIGSGEVADGADRKRFECGLGADADAPEGAGRERAEECGFVARCDDDEAVGLAGIGGNLGDGLVGAGADRD